LAVYPAASSILLRLAGIVFDIGVGELLVYCGDIVRLYWRGADAEVVELVDAFALMAASDRAMRTSRS
jgi:hypothetical protein